MHYNLQILPFVDIEAIEHNILFEDTENEWGLGK